MSVRRLRLSIDSNLEDACLVGLAVGRIATFSGLGEIESCHVEVCVIEAVNNCVRHAYGEVPGHEIRVDVVASEQSITIDVCDRGASFEVARRKISEVEINPEDRASLPSCGLGLPIIHDVMDRVEFASVDGWNVLTMERIIQAEATRA